MVRRELAPLRAFGRYLYALRGLAGLSLLIFPSVASGQTNLAPNPSFETVANALPQNWSLCANSGAATLGVATSPVDQGARSLKVTVAQTGDVGVCSDAIPVPPDVTFRLAARSDVNIASTQNKQARLQILELSSADALLSSRIVGTSIGRISGWESISGFFTTGPSTAKVRIRLLPDVPGSNGVAFYWDSVSLARDTAVAWERWERELTASADYSAGANSNPYRDLRLQATFFRGTPCGAPPSLCKLPGCFQQAGFWDGTQGSSAARAFKVRTTLPAGDWCWQTFCSTLAAPGGTTPSCAGDAGLTQSGALKVTAYAGENKLYTLGLPAPKAGGSFLVYGDGTTTFPWIADTAWSAPKGFSLPSLGSPPSADLWKNYVADRAAKKFTVLLVAPATQYVNAPVSRPAPPASGYAGFLAGAGCNPANYGVVPNECSYLDPAYWRKLDSMIKDANDAGIVVVVAGLIDPTDRGGPGTEITPLQKYPGKSAAETFARQLAARLAGSFVFFSPGFDDKVTESLDDGLKVQDAMTAVGQALRGSPGGAAPRHLVGNQLAGGASLTDYDLFHAANWLSFEFYQSGHKGNQGTPCTYGDGQEYARSVCRARELTLRFRCQGALSTVQACPAVLPPGQKKPSVNSEGAYEDFETAAEDPDNREGVRATAYASALSGSFGYTIAVKGIYKWNNPEIYSDSYGNDQSKADGDLARMGGLFRGAPWTDLEPRSNLIANNPAVNTATTTPIFTNANPANEKKRMFLAGNSSYALVYVPGITPSSFTGVKIKTANVTNALPGLNCTKSWSKGWVNPRTPSEEVLGTCSTGNDGSITIKAPLTCPGAASCDWILRLTKVTTGGGSSPFAIDLTAGIGDSKLNDVEVWTALSTDSSTSSVFAQILGSDGLPAAKPIVVSPDGISFQKLPTAARDTAGNFFIAWEAESSVTGLDEISAQWYDNEGNPLSEIFAVSAPASGQQTEPSVTADPYNQAAVSWTRYPLGDDPGSVKVQIFDGKGPTEKEIIDLPSHPGGVATMSLVQADGQGNLWVAWTEEDRENEGGDVYAQRILRSGTLDGPSIRVNTTHAGVGRLAALQVERDGSVRLVWEGLDADGQGKGLRERRYDPLGRSVGDEAPVNSLE